MPEFRLPQRQRVVFLGTPAVAARALEILFAEEELLQIVLVVSQPPARAARGTTLTPSPVHALALERGIPVLTPETAKDDAFLGMLESLAPDLCITAAYGNILPERFLAIPKRGTLNIHPSLLPLYRGAAPVQRAVEEGSATTGVSVAFTVLAMDAGPIAAQVNEALDPNIKAPALLAHLFEVGARALVEVLPNIVNGSLVPVPQDSARVTKAKKLSVDEGILHWNEPALRLHNKVRAFAGWPGTRARLMVAGEPQDMKIVTTRVGPVSSRAPDTLLECEFRNDALIVACDDGSSLEILELQPPGKRVLPARDFWNGLRTKDVRRLASDGSSVPMRKERE